MNILQILLGLSLIYYSSAITIPGIQPSPRYRKLHFPNEEFDARNPYRCQTTCEQYGNPSCGDYAPAGECYCKNGYIRLSTNGICVPINKSNCRVKMPPTKASCARLQNERLSEYAYDEPCGNLCSNHLVPCNKFVPAVMLWSPHCVCKEGYSRLPNGKCVAIDSPVCKALWKPSEAQCVKRGNEIYGWGSACQTTCQELVQGDFLMCTMNLVEDCYCPEGMVRYVNGGECVPEYDK